MALCIGVIRQVSAITLIGSITYTIGIGINTLISAITLIALCISVITPVSYTHLTLPTIVGV